ncbi:MAG: hypothetical protein MOGMAGMI_02454 [Candidatus Omnitrophica bacterium]|nr:hypothetical protein [Candidatus Omnitrophota bacterium]
MQSTTALTPFFTPPEAIRLMLSVLDPHTDQHDGVRILEPCAGEGRIIRELRGAYPEACLMAVEPRDELRGDCDAAGADVVVTSGAVEYAERLAIGRYRPFDIIVTNPPFSMACDIWDACWPLLRHGGQQVFFQRLSWLSSQSRAEFWDRYPGTDVWVCPGRFSFVDSGAVDRWDYGVFVCRKGDHERTGRWRRLPVEGGEA